MVHADEILADAASMRLVPPAVRGDWEERPAFQTFQSILRPINPLELENVRILYEAGVTLLTGTDVGVALQVPGISLHRQLLRLTEAGLVLLDADPLADIHNTQQIRAVVADGRLYRRADLDRLLAGSRAWKKQTGNGE